MVRTIITIVLCLCLGAIGTGTAHAETTTETEIYNYPVMTLSEEESAELYALSQSAYQGTISTTFLTFFKDIVATIPITHDYVFYRSSDDTYAMVSGDLTLSGDTFILEGDGVGYEITQVSGSGYGSSYYSYTVSDISNFSMDTNGYLVYSNLGDYPQLESRGVQYEFALLVAVCVVGVCALVRPLSNFVLRFRSGIGV